MIKQFPHCKMILKSKTPFICGFILGWVIPLAVMTLTLQSFLILTHIGEVRLRKSLKCANYFHPLVLDLVGRCCSNSSARAFWLGMREQREGLFVSLAARLSAQGALDIWDGKLKVALMKKAACVLETAASRRPRGVARVPRRKMSTLSRFSCDDFLTLQALAVVGCKCKISRVRSWSLFAQRGLLSATFIYTIRPLALLDATSSLLPGPE